MGIDGGGAHELQESSGNVSLSGPGANAAVGGGGAVAGAYAGPPPAMSAPRMASDMGQHMGQAAAQEMASQVMHNAGRAIRRGAGEISVYVQANPYSVTLMSFLGGCWLILASILWLLNPLNMTDPLIYILAIYQLFFGLLIVAIDGPNDRLPDFVRSRIINFTALLQSRVVRIFFYLFIACQQASQKGTWFFTTLAGWYFAAVAIGYTLVYMSSPQVASNSARESLTGPAGAH